MTRSDTIFLSDAKKQYKVWKKSYKKRNRKYSNKVIKINETFNLKNTDELNTKLAPQFWSGDIDSNPKFIVCKSESKIKRC